MVDDRGGVARRRGRRPPRRVDVPARALPSGDLRDPAPHVRPVRVEPLSLKVGVEDPEEGLGVGSAAGGPLPASVVGRGVAVGEVRPEVRLATAPVDEEVLREKRGDDHPDAVVHPPLVRELPHPRVDDRVAGAPFAPGREARVGQLSRDPGEAVGLGPEALGQDPGERREDRGVELPPCQLADEDVDRLSTLGVGVLPPESRLGEEAPDADSPEAQVCREAGRPLDSGEVPGFGVPAQRADAKEVPELPALSLAALRVRGRTLHAEAGGP